MRGLTSGFGARMSSMDLFITFVHRTDHAFDELDLVFCKAILLVEVFVCPFAVHRQLGDESKSVAVKVLSICSQRDKESHKLGTQVATEVGGFRLGTEPTCNEIRLCTRGP